MRDLYAFGVFLMPSVAWSMAVYKFQLPVEIGLLVGVPLGLLSGVLAFTVAD
jgi:hypothetical protein